MTRLAAPVEATTIGAAGRAPTPGRSKNFREATLVLHDSTVNDAAFSRDGRLLATASYDKTARVWELPSGRSCTHHPRKCGVVGLVQPR